MTTKITLLVLIIISSFSANAQYSYTTYGTFGNGSMLHIGQCIYNWDNNTLSWVNGDSSVLSYNSQKLLANRLEKYYDTGNSSYEFRANYRREYDANNLLVLDIDSFANQNLGSHVSYTYNAQNKESVVLLKTWNAGWKNFSRTQFTYTSFDSVDTELSESWISNAWKNRARSLHAYNLQNLESVRTNEEWAVNQWRGSSKYLYTYNANNQLISYTFQKFDTLSATYTNFAKFDYTYNTNGNISSETQLFWNTAAASWKNFSRTYYTYNAADLLTLIETFDWNGTTSSWEAYFQYKNTYNMNNLIDTTKTLVFNGTSWKNNSYNAYTYNANKYVTKFEKFIWNTNINTWKNEVYINNWYSNKYPTAIIDTKPTVQLSIYPNPVNNGLLFVNTDSKTNFTITNMHGQIVKRGNLNQGSNSIILDQPSGIYILHSGGSSSKIVIE